jgi:hypothetical protein
MLRSGVPERVNDLERGRESDAVCVSVATYVSVAVVACVIDFHVKFFVGVGVSDMGVTGYVAVKERKQRVSLHSLKLTFENIAAGTEAVRAATAAVTVVRIADDVHAPTVVTALALERHASRVDCVTNTPRWPDDVAGSAGADTHVPLAGHVRQQRYTRITTSLAEAATVVAKLIRLAGAVIVDVITFTSHACTVALVSPHMPTPGTKLRKKVDVGSVDETLAALPSKTTYVRCSCQAALPYVPATPNAPTNVPLPAAPAIDDTPI